MPPSKQSLENYPAIKEVCELFDLQLLSEVDFRHDIEPARTYYFIGRPAERAAGLWSYDLTPGYHHDMEQLEWFCIGHIVWLRKYAAEKEDLPDYGWWEKADVCSGR